MQDLERDLADAWYMQRVLLPDDLKNEYLEVSSIYAPFSQVSGDCLGFRWEDSEKTLYGYIFDVKGHNFASAMHVSLIHLLFFQISKRTNNICEILKYVNNELFWDDQQKLLVTAIIFSLNPADKTLEYSSAGISPFYIFGEKRYTVKTSGYPLGYDKNSTYQLSKMSFAGAKSLIFASDGFTELYDSKNQVTCMHDDATAILIKLRD